MTLGDPICHAFRLLVSTKAYAFALVDMLSGTRYHTGEWRAGMIAQSTRPVSDAIIPDLEQCSQSLLFPFRTRP